MSVFKANCGAVAKIPLQNETTMINQYALTRENIRAATGLTDNQLRPLLKGLPTLLADAGSLGGSAEQMFTASAVIPRLKQHPQFTEGAERSFIARSIFTTGLNHKCMKKTTANARTNSSKLFCQLK